MILFNTGSPQLYTERLTLRPPQNRDHEEWAQLRETSQNFLKPWEPLWEEDHLSRSSFNNRVKWARKSIVAQTAFPFMLIKENTIIGAITLDHVRGAPSRSGIVGFWVGKEYARNGYMKEALEAVVHFAFEEINISRIEASCLPTNKASRGLLEVSGFKYEGIAQSYLEIAGKWQNHVIYANLRSDRRGTAI